MYRLSLILITFLISAPAMGDAPEVLSLDAPRAGAVSDTCKKVGLIDRMAAREIRLSRTFLDSFDSLDLEAGPWTPHFAHAKYGTWQSRTLEGNLEEQIYVDEAYSGRDDAALGLDPHQIADGVLRLTADRTPANRAKALDPFAYTSGMISSHRHFTQKYGYFEISARVPQGRGLWPAFWLLRAGMWPPEIDVMEVLGHDTGTLYTTVHWTQNGRHAQSGCEIGLKDASQEFHLFGVLWTNEMIVHYVDRKPVAVIETKPELDGPMYMLANLAVGGRWPGSPDAATPFPASYEIDWIAAYQLDPQ